MEMGQGCRLGDDGDGPGGRWWWSGLGSVVGGGEKGSVSRKVVEIESTGFADSMDYEMQGKSRKLSQQILA